MDDKRYKKLIDEVKSVGDAGKDMASSEELKNLEVLYLKNNKGA